MEYQFSFGWMIGGVVIALIGALVIVFYRQISDTIANGVASYEKMKLYGVITVIVGLLTASNLLSFILEFVFRFLLGKN